MTQFDTATVIALALAALAGFETLLRGVSMILHAIAPHTKTTADDKLAESVDALHEKVDVLLQIAPKPPGAVPIIKAAGPAVLLLALLACTAQVSCGATTKSVESDAKTAVVNCTAQDLGTTPRLDAATLVAVVNLVAAERAKCTPVGGSLDWKCVEADLLAQGKVLGGCALVAMVTSATSKPATSNLVASSGPRPGAAQLVDFCQRAAPGVTYHTSAGDSTCP